MAGTRRRSRIGDTTTSTSRLEPVGSGDVDVVVEVEAEAEAKAQAEVADSVDNGSVPASPEQRSTVGACKRCKETVGHFFNSWHKITGTYYLPALAGSYSSRLRAHGRQKAATPGTGLDGCTIQPLACPSCSDVLGFNAVIVPAVKEPFRGRDFFKLSRIELRCEIAPNKFQAVEPHVDAPPEPLRVDDSDRPSPVPVPVIPPPPPPDDMEVDTRPSHASQPPPPPSGPPHQTRHEQHQHHQHQQRDHHHYHQPLQQVEANRQSLPPSIRSPTASAPHALHQKSPSNPLPSPSPAVKPVHDVQFAPPPSRETTAALANRTRELPPVMSHSHSPADQHRVNGQYYPRSPPEVSLDAIERLQTQISQNSGALSVQNRDMQLLRETAQRVEESLRREFQTQLHQQTSEIHRVDEAVGRLQHEMRGVREVLEVLNREVQARSLGPGAGPSVSAQDSALELMAQQVAVISQKANEVDTLKITIEIMKNKIQRLEDNAAPGLPQPQSQTAFASPREPTAHSAHTVPSYHTTPSTVPHINTPVHPTQRPASFHSHGSHSAATPEVSQKAESAQAQSGWVTVNSSVKRAHPNGIDGPHDPLGQPVGSPKRPKLAPLEPRVAYESSQSHPHQHVYDHMDTDDSESRLQTHSHTLPSQTHSHESLTGSPLAQSTLASQHPQHAVYAPYSTQDAPSDDSWRPESQRVIEHRTPRGRGRGGGPGSRGGRGRKSMPAPVHLGTPEWEKDEWQGATESQTSPDGYYNHVSRSGRGIIRRGSGGSSRGRPSSSSGRAVSLGMQGVTTGVGLPADPYAHTKKTRTKPIRNADGILIRKDGRPDMRSQSSAANLRKVHARKEELKEADRAFTPSSGLQQSTSMDTETPSPTGYLPPGQDVTPSVQKKHSAIMGKMFPGGIDESRKEHDYARRVFEEDEGHTAQPRGQHHLPHHHHAGDGRPLEIKREQAEERVADSQSPNDEDIDMDRTEDHADDEDQTPSDHSDNSAQYHDASNREERTPHEQPKENGVQAVTQSTAETSQTVEAASAQAA